MAPGPYVITAIPPLNITITVPEAWERLSVPSMVWAAPNTATNLGFCSVLNLYVDPCAIDREMLDPPPSPSVDDLVAALAALPGMETTAPTEVTVDGYAGKYVELRDRPRGLSATAARTRSCGLFPTASRYRPRRLPLTRTGCGSLTSPGNA